MAEERQDKPGGGPILPGVPEQTVDVRRTLIQLGINLDEMGQLLLGGLPLGESFVRSGTPDGTKFLRDDRTWASVGLSAVWPVGSIFISAVSTNPNTLLGFGTWTAFATGRTLVGIDAGQTEFDTVEETGGAKTHQLVTSEIPSHTHTQNSHNHTQDSHNHTQNSHDHQTSGNAAFLQAGGTGIVQITQWGGAFHDSTANKGTDAVTATNQATTATNQATTATNQNTGGDGAHNNLQPYIVVYMWKRTA